MEFPKFALILCICVISTSIFAIATNEVLHDETDKQAPTKIHQDDLRSDKTGKEYKTLSDYNLSLIHI